MGSACELFPLTLQGPSTCIVYTLGPKYLLSTYYNGTWTLWVFAAQKLASATFVQAMGSPEELETDRIFGPQLVPFWVL